MKRLISILLKLLLVVSGLTALAYATAASPLLQDDLLRSLISYTADHGLFSMATDDNPYEFSRENRRFTVTGYLVDWNGTRDGWEARAAGLKQDLQDNYGLEVNLAVSDRGLVVLGGNFAIDASEFAENLPLTGGYPANRAAIKAALKQQAYIGFRQAGRYLNSHGSFLGLIMYLVEGFCLWTKMPLALFFGVGGRVALFLTIAGAVALLAGVGYWVIHPTFRAGAIARIK